MKILLLYTGGTIGCIPKNPQDPKSNLVPATSLNELLKLVPTWDPSTQTVTTQDDVIQIELDALEKPIDSADMGIEHWLMIAKKLTLRLNQDCQGCVILHGTDTLAYTASALSFLLQNLAFPVVLTGSQLPLSYPRSDALQNILGALSFATNPHLTEVSVFFQQYLYRGNRLVKISSSHLNAFDSPNYPPLGRIEERLEISPQIRPKQKTPLFSDMESRVACVDVFPAMQAELLDSLLNSGIRGIVLRCFGSGNIPRHTGFLDFLDRAEQKNVLIVAVTQCLSGFVDLSLYEGGVELLKRGAVGGQDLTTEAALTKMSFILTQTSDFNEARDWMQINLCGEQDLSCFYLHFKPGWLEQNDTMSQNSLPLSQGDLLGGRTKRSCLLWMLGVDLAGSASLDLQLSDARGHSQNYTIRNWVFPDYLRLNLDLFQELDFEQGITLKITNRGGLLRWKKLFLALQTS